MLPVNNFIRMAVMTGLLLVGLLWPSCRAYTPVSVADLATRYEHGEGVAKNLVLARDLYCFGALFDELNAVYGLGWMIANGRGEDRDDAVAAGWFARAVSLGDAHSQYMLDQLGEVDHAPDAKCPTADAKPDRETIRRWVGVIAPRYALEPEWVLAVIEAESNFRVRALSPKGAQGLMQLMPATAQRFDVKNAWDPVQNILGGVRYLRWLLDHFEGDPTLALAGYNAGESAVRRYQGVPPYRETQGYVRKIIRNLSDCGDNS